MELEHGAFIAWDIGGVVLNIMHGAVLGYCVLGM